jgi:hypothetical protein
MRISPTIESATGNHVMFPFVGTEQARRARRRYRQQSVEQQDRETVKELLPPDRTCQIPMSLQA